VQESLRRFAEDITEPFYYVVDVTRMTYNFGDVLYASRSVTKKEAFVNHPLVIEAIFVVSMNPLVQNVLIDWGAIALGAYMPQVFESLDDAISYIQSKVQSLNTGQ